MSLDAYQEILALQPQRNTIIELRHEDVVLQIDVNESTESIVDLGYSYSRPAHDPNDVLHIPGRAILGTTDIREEIY